MKIDSTIDHTVNGAADCLTLRGQTRSWTLGRRTTIMGVLNLTPDSFYDGGKYLDKGLAVERALQMAQEGADWIDIGGESTRPGAASVEESEEIRRTLPVVEALVKEGMVVSIDTMKAGVAEAALSAGAEIVNDVSALSFDPRMVKVCVEYGAAVVLMHKRGTPESMQEDVEYDDLLAVVSTYLDSRIKFALKSGVEFSSIVLDPGIGFGKSATGSAQLIKQLGRFGRFGLPVLVGPSRKSFIGQLLGSTREDKEVGGSPKERLAGTIAACTAAILNGANIIRVHDVKEARDAASVADAIKGFS